MTDIAKRREVGQPTRMRVFIRDGFCCLYCGIPGDTSTLVVDHIIPVALGGTNDTDNLCTSCSTCNRKKSDQLLPEDKRPRVRPIPTRTEEEQRHTFICDCINAAVNDLPITMDEAVWKAATVVLSMEEIGTAFGAIDDTLRRCGQEISDALNATLRRMIADPRRVGSVA